MDYDKHGYFMITYLYFKRGVNFSLPILEMRQDCPGISVKWGLSLRSRSPRKVICSGMIHQSRSEPGPLLGGWSRTVNWEDQTAMPNQGRQK